MMWPLLAVAALAWMPISSAMGAGAREAMREPGLELHSAVEFDGQGRPRRLTVDLRNGTSQPLCLIGAPDAAWSVAGLQAVVLGSFGRVGAYPAGSSPAAVRNVQVLAPGMHRAVSVDFAAFVAAWPDDRYLVAASYASPAADVAALQADGRFQGCRPAAGTVHSSPIEFRVTGASGAITQDHFQRLWQSGAAAGAEERWKALRWLGRNALQPGMTRQQLLSILGQPAETRDRRQWVYRIGSNAGGLIVRFSGDEVEQVDFFES